MAKRLFSRFVKILTSDDAGVHNMNRLERFVHFWALVGNSFSRNRCPVRAASLSYTSLLALVPLLAVVISVSSSLLKSEGEQQIYGAIDRFVSSVMPPAPVKANGSGVGETSTNSESGETITNAAAVNGTQTAQGRAPETADENTRLATAQTQAAKYIHEFIKNTRSAALGVTGMVLLVFIAIQMLSSVEATFNDIWGVTQGRNWLWRIVLYWTTITLGPLLMIAALGLTGGPHLEAVKSLVSRMPFVGGLVFKFLPFVVMWLTFSLIYILVPNTKVHFSAALVGGGVGGFLWHMNSVFGFLYVSRVVTNSKIYGSLGLVPVFMAGLYLFWLILLFGSQVTYAFQNRRAYSQEKLVENVNQRGQEFIALRLMTCVGQCFQRGKKPITLQEMSVELGVPSRLAQQVLQPLLAARLVTEVADREPAYTPGRPLETITAHDVLLAMRSSGGQELSLRDRHVRPEVYGEFARIEEAERQAASAVTMLALVNRFPARPEIAAPPPEAPPPSGPPRSSEAPSVDRHEEAASEERDFPL